jgi:rhodanese-related sulfurtransferase
MMIRRIGQAQVQQLQTSGAQVIEVLSRQQYEKQHIPGAISIPLSRMTESRVASVPKDRPVVVYCWDYQ